MKMLLQHIAIASLLLFSPGSAIGEEKSVIGAIEFVVILPFNEALPARVDTGAALSSIDARNIQVKGGRVRFRLPAKYGGHLFRLPLAYKADFKTSTGREERPIVVMELCLGKKRVRTLVNLKNRRRLKFPVLLGREALSGSFLVDVSQKFQLKIECGN